MAARLDHQILIVPVSGYSPSQGQITTTPAEMAGFSFDPEHSGWAANAEIGDCLSVCYGNCKCVLIRMR